VAIVIRDKPGLSLFCKGSYKLNETNLSVFNPPSIISSSKGSVIVFNTSIVREDPFVKVTGWVGILLLYKEGNTGS
jgi:hypothetical protein